MFKKLLLLLFFASFFASPAWAAIEVYEFDLEEQEQRFKKLTSEMRCPMCLNINLSGSDAPIASDLRAEIYDQIREGRSNDEIIDFMTVRYGDFILYRPPLNRGTFFLWFGPGLMLLAGFIVVVRMLKSSQASANDTGLSPEENKKLQEILSSHSDS